MPEGERETLLKEQLWDALEKAETTDDLAKLADHAATIGYSHDGRYLTAIRAKYAALGDGGPDNGA